MLNFQSFEFNKLLLNAILVIYNLYDYAQKLFDITKEMIPKSATYVVSN